MEMSGFEVFREDGETVGYITSDDENSWQPHTVLGAPIGPALPREDATEVLMTMGLPLLAERWVLDHAGQEVTVEIVEASRSQVQVRYIDFGHPELHGRWKTLDAPVGDALRPKVP